MHHGKDPDVVKHVHIDHIVRELSAEVPPCGRGKSPKAFGVASDVTEQALDLQIEAKPQSLIDVRVVVYGLGELRVRFRMLARDSSTGIPCTVPASISVILRATSFRHATSM